MVKGFDVENVAWISFFAAAALASGFFFFRQRRFDFLVIAYIGAMFYFLPLFFDRVLQSSAEFSTTVSVPVFLIATTYLVALVLVAILSEPFYRNQPSTPGRPMSGWYAVIALGGLVGALVASKGEVIDADKVQALKQVGYFYVLFEIAASLACISAVMERRWWVTAGSALLLAVDLLVGFRVFVVLTALSVAVVLLMRDGRIRLFTKIPTYGIAALVLIASMLLLHSARFAIFEQIATLRGAPESSRVTKPSEMRGDTIQYNEASKPAETAKPAAPERPVSTVAKWAAIPFNLLQQSEPFMIQATLVAVVQRPLSCNPSNIFKSLFLLVPPGLTKFVPNPYPLTFYEEYQPVLYPNVTYGMGGNIWAEMLCRFGYVGVVIFGGLMIFGLVGLYQLLMKAPPALTAPLALGGVVIAFYIERNDLNYTLVMLRQIMFVFGGAYGLSFIAGKVRTWAGRSAD